MHASVPCAGAFVVALDFVVGPCAAIPAAANNTTSVDRIGASQPKTLRGMRITTVRRHDAPAPSYTIHNFGAPGGYDFSFPSGFNNTGQIFGQGGHSLQTGGSVEDCVVFSAGAFRRVPVLAAAGYNTGCVANGINDADATTGQYEVVGSATEEFSNNAHAFAAVAGATGFQRAVTYFAYAPSRMVGVSASRLSVAAAEFDRDTAYDVTGPLYSTTSSASGSLTQLQTLPSATAPVVHVLVPTYQNPCPFGGCAIDARNRVLGYDYRTVLNGYATVAIFTAGDQSSLVHVPLQDAVSYGYPPTAASAATYPVAFNDRGDLLYLDATLQSPAIYNIDTGTRTVIPVSSPICNNPVPLSMNNLGEVLGSFQYCSTPTPTYFTWDPVHGTQYLNAQLPASPYTIAPLGVNDRGQILAKLTSSASVASWGTLDPVAPAAANAHLRKRNVRPQ